MTPKLFLQFYNCKKNVRLERGKMSTSLNEVMSPFAIMCISVG